MRNLRIRLILIILLLTVTAVKAELKLPALFTDNMILQQQMEVPIWGWSDNKSDITIKTSWDGKTYTAVLGSEGKWQVKMNTPVAGGSYTITIQQGSETKSIRNVLVGEVWLCSGQSNMEMPLKGFPGQPVLGGNEQIVHSTNNQIRFITVPRATVLSPEKDFEGNWQEAKPQTVADFSATAWYFGSLLQEVLKVPVGLIHVSYGGSSVEAWMNEEMLKDFSEIKIPNTEEDLKKDPNRVPTTLFNGMLAPVIGYGIKGSIWYQGESNYERPFQYKKLFETMVEDWRGLWEQGDFPFYFAQIAPFNYGQFHPDDALEKYNSAYLREAQLQASKTISNSGIAILMDVAEENNIHPKNKEKGGVRLGLLALTKTYGISGFEFESPEFNTLEINEGKVTVSFNNVPNGITAYDQEITGFQLAGNDRVFYPAEVVLRRKSVILSSSKVQKPVAVRYLFKDYAQAELFSTGGLPVSSFRTDDWEPQD
ncbi:sialate O-acetylesterase [Leeuwenhoekiella marinoflava]|uniref:sialate O-acetylesterase n=1 Tax=Leeuwenhoekiella marinoflava TaxID=988 RepID=UPI0030027055